MIPAGDSQGPRPAENLSPRAESRTTADCGQTQAMVSNGEVTPTANVGSRWRCYP